MNWQVFWQVATLVDSLLAIAVFIFTSYFDKKALFQFGSCLSKNKWSKHFWIMLACESVFILALPFLGGMAL